MEVCCTSHALHGTAYYTALPVLEHRNPDLCYSVDL